MKFHSGQGWIRRGVSLLWEPRALSIIAGPKDVVSMRQFFAMARSWPEELPAASGDALVVAGLEGCLDALEEVDAEDWLRHDLKRAVLAFQDEYQGQAALIFWLPTGRRRIEMMRATERYFWRRGTGKTEPNLPLGACLYGGAEADAERILRSEEKNPDFDGDAWIGLFHPRIS